MDKQEFIFITRFFSGLFETIEKELWHPTGIPTITNLVDEVSKKHMVTWVLVCKTERESSVINHNQKKVIINGIQFIIYPYRSFPPIINKFNNLIQTITFFYEFRLFFKNKKKAIYYLDRSNIILASLLKRKYNAFIVIRILGIYPSQKKLTKNYFYRLSRALTYYSYKRNYSLCIGTQDGSGTEHYIDKLIHKLTPRKVLLNGVAFNTKKEKKKKDKIHILFVGTLTPTKGVIELIEAAIKIQKYRDKIQINIVGKGILENELQLFIEKNNLTDFVSLIGTLPKEKVAEMYLKSHIYVSLNKLGNLSNTVLEAFSFSKCIFILEKEPALHIDEYTDKFIPHDTVIKVKRQNTSEDLSNKIIDLIKNPHKINFYIQKSEEFTNANIQSWNERIANEIATIIELYSAKKMNSNNLKNRM